MQEIFAFEDELTRGVIGLLTPLRAETGKSQAVRRDVPANARAFELFLRGLEQARVMTQVPEARESFQMALDHDPAFAPAWAWIGRCHRIIGKYVENYADNDRLAEEAFRRALALSPDLPTAHRFYTHWESEHGRADAAVSRLLQHAKANRNDAQLFAALVHACRYAGLLGASWAAHQEARRLDPTVATSAEYTLLMLGDIPAIERYTDPGSSDGALAYALMLTGRVEEVKSRLQTVNLDQFPPGYRGMIEAVKTMGDDPAVTLDALDRAMAIGASNDPEAVFLHGTVAALLGADSRALAMIANSVNDGLAPVFPMERAAVLERLRRDPDFAKPLDRARQRRQIALAVFVRGGGPELLGISPDAAL
jgi:hypothetical protein